MKRSQLMLTTVVTTLVLVITSLVSAQYNPQLGRFHQRDPLGTGPRVEFSGTGAPYFVGTTGPKAPDPAYTVIRPRVQRSSSPSRLVRVNETKPVGRVVPGNSKSDSNNQSKRNLEIQYPDGLNLYEYVKSNPVNYGDPYGLVPCGITFNKDVKKRGILGIIDKPTHYWLWGKKQWDFGPDIAWIKRTYNPKPPYSLKWYENCGILHHCEGIAPWPGNYNRVGDYSKTLKEKKHGHLKAGGPGVKDKACKCVTCGDIEACLDDMVTIWDKKSYDHWFQNCRTFVYDAMGKCCLKK